MVLQNIINLQIIVGTVTAVFDLIHIFLKIIIDIDDLDLILELILQNQIYLCNNAYCINFGITY